MEVEGKYTHPNDEFHIISYRLFPISFRFFFFFFFFWSFFFLLCLYRSRFICLDADASIDMFFMR